MIIIVVACCDKRPVKQHAVLHKRNGSQVQLSCRNLLSQQAGRREDLPVNQQLGPLERAQIPLEMPWSCQPMGTTVTTSDLPWGYWLRCSKDKANQRCSAKRRRSWRLLESGLIWGIYCQCRSCSFCSLARLCFGCCIFVTSRSSCGCWHAEDSVWICMSMWWYLDGDEVVGQDHVSMV